MNREKMLFTSITVDYFCSFGFRGTPMDYALPFQQILLNIFGSLTLGDKRLAGFAQMIFLRKFFDHNDQISVKAFKGLLLNNANPPYVEFQVLNLFRRNELKVTADFLHSLISE